MGRRDEGFFSARDNTRLYWQSLLPDGDFQDVIGLVHGFGDHSGRYRRVMAALVAEGHAVLAFDCRGHGKSDGKRGHCDRWEDYLDDMEVFWARLRQLGGGKPTFILAHSHGGLISTHFAARKPEGLRGMVLSSPYYRTAKPPSPLLLGMAKILSNVTPRLAVDLGLNSAQLSRDLVWQRETDADPLYGRKGSMRWGTTHLLAQQQLNGLGSQISCPLLMLTGGDDPVVSVPAAKGFFDTISSPDKTYKEYPGMLHEVMCEVGKEDVWADISRWISSHR